MKVTSTLSPQDFAPILMILGGRGSFVVRNTGTCAPEFLRRREYNFETGGVQSSVFSGLFYHNFTAD